MEDQNGKEEARIQKCQKVVKGPWETPADILNSAFDLKMHLKDKVASKRGHNKELCSLDR